MKLFLSEIIPSLVASIKPLLYTLSIIVLPVNTIDSISIFDNESLTLYNDVLNW